MPLICSACKKKKPLTQFGPDAKTSTGKSSWCKQCKREYQREYAKQRREDPRWREAHNKQARSSRVNWYGINEQDYEEIQALQGDGCAGCGYKPPPEKRRLDIDHRHQKQDKKREPWERAPMVRGLLCHRCNRVLGILKDNPETLRKLAAYLESPPAHKILLPKFQRMAEYLAQYEKRKQEQLSEQEEKESE